MTTTSLHEGLREQMALATRLHAVAQGALELFDNVHTDGSPAANATYALLEVMIAKADELSSGLEQLETVARAATKEARQ